MMAARHALAIFALVGMFVLSMQYPAKPYYRGKDRADMMTFLRYYLKFLEMRDSQGIVKGGCIKVGDYGCEANNANCCREPMFTGPLRKCVNTGSFSSPKYQCQEE